jgi:two-component system, cell cycle sensor histidine kinase and response regulator CckA
MKVDYEQWGAPTILVVDDDPCIRSFVASILRAYNYAVLCVENAEEAFDLVKNRVADIALLLTDMHMPGICGVDLIRNVRKLRPEMPVLAMSGNLDVWIEQLDGIPCIAKPFCIRTLLSEIEKLYGARRPDCGMFRRSEDRLLAWE